MKKKKSLQKNRTHNIFNCLVSVIIPVYRRFDLLKLCLESIPKAFNDISYEVIVVDNGSPIEDRQYHAMVESFPKTKLIKVNNNIGFPKACNLGFSQSNGSLSFFLNSDVIMDEGSGEKLVRAMDDPSIGIVGMKLRFPSQDQLIESGLKHSSVQRNPGSIQHVGLFTNTKGQVIHMYLGWSRNNPRVNKVREAYAVTGAALMIRKQLFIQAGKFDLDFGAGTYEDVSLCLTVRELGHNIIVETQAEGVHYTGATAEKFQAGFPLSQNQIIFNQKWYNKLQYTEYLYW